MASRNKKSIMRRDTLGGFTIIEVVLVLAIAGLIFMMVFIALPQLQRAQRDTQRRTNLTAFQSAITQYQSNNNGKIPGQTLGGTDGTDVCQGVTEFVDFDTSATSCRLMKTYMNAAGAEENLFTDPDGTPYNIAIYGSTIDFSAPTEVDHTIYMFVRAKCGEDETVTSASNPRDYAILYKLEGSGLYCEDNQ